MLRSPGRGWIGLAEVLVVLTGGLLAGCGDGNDGAEEEALRAKIEKGFERTAHAPTLTVALDYQIGEEAGEPELGGCLEFAVDKKGPGDGDDRLDMKAIHDGCDGAQITAEVIGVGSDVWVRKGSDRYSPATIDPAVLPKLADGAIDYRTLPAAAEDISEASEPEAFSYPEKQEEFKGPRYKFKAPATAFAQTGDLSDTDVDFEVALDGRGCLRELVGTVSAEGAEGVITVTYDEVDPIEPIEPPPSGDVKGQVKRIDSEDELEALLAGPFGAAF
jgi:hypothetical protein